MSKENQININELENVSGGTITSDQAYAAALKDAKVAKANASLKKNKLDRDDGRLVYEIEFVSGATEYEYDIDAATGAVISASHDLWD